MALINQAPPKTLAEHVIERIREDVLSGKFAPGERLDQAQLAQSLLQVAATYPDCAVRCELIGVYGVFQVAANQNVPLLR